MKKSILSMMLVAGAMVLVTGCGGSGSNSKVADDGVFGNLPQVIAEQGDKAVALLDELSKVKSVEEAKAVSEKVQAAEGEAKKALEEAWATLADKEIPADVNPDIPFKVTQAFKLDTEKSKEDKLEFVAYVENTAETYRGFTRNGPDDSSKFNTKNVKVLLVDGDGQPVCTPYRAGYDHAVAEGEDLYAVGSKGKVTVKLKLEPWMAEFMGKTKKFLIVSDESEEYKTTRKATDDADMAYTDKVRELAKQAVEAVKGNVK